MHHQKFLKMLKPKPALVILQLCCLRILSVLWLMWHFQLKQPPRRAVRLCCVCTGERECGSVRMYMYERGSESACVQCRNVARHRQLWNFPIKSQCVSIGCLGFFFPACCPPVSFPFMSAERGRERLRNASRPPQATGGAGQFPRQVEHATAALSEIPGSWCPGTGGGEALALGAAAVARGPSKSCSSSQKFDFYFLKGLEKLLTTVDDVRVDLIKGLFSCWQRCAP